MVADTVIYLYTKKFKKAGQGHFRMVSKRNERSENDT